MADSIGAIPFSIGGTNASGYSLVDVFSLTYSQNVHSISSSNYDFGIISYDQFNLCFLKSLFYFTNVPMQYNLFLISSLGTEGRICTFYVDSTRIYFAVSQTSDILSIAVFKFT